MVHYLNKEEEWGSEHSGPLCKCHQVSGSSWFHEVPFPKLCYHEELISIDHTEPSGQLQPCSHRWISQRIVMVMLMVFGFPAQGSLGFQISFNVKGFSSHSRIVGIQWKLTAVMGDVFLYRERIRVGQHISQCFMGQVRLNLFP